MASEQDLTTHGRARLSFATEADIDEFVSVLEKYERGELTPDQWRAFRLVRGTYGQRQAADAQMLRIKVPQGVLTSDQLAARFDVSPYAEALTRFLLRHRLASTLPRKFKIAFEGCPEDHVATAINDLGFF